MSIQRLCRTLKYVVSALVLSCTVNHAIAGYVPITLAPATVGQSYSVDLAAAARAAGPGTYDIPFISTSGTVAPGLTINLLTGILSGVPTLAGSYLDADARSFSVQFGDLLGGGMGSQAWFEMIVNAATGPSSADTQQSLHNTLTVLRGLYALQNLAISTGLTYDCTVFDAKGVCVSAGGRYQRISGADLNTNQGLLIGALRLNDQWRVGAWVEQGASANTGTGVRVHNGAPLFGVFGVWSQRPVMEGWQARIAAGYGNNDLTTTRGVVGTSEAGTGTTRMNMQGASAVISYHVPVAVSWTASPYAGVRYTKVKANGYAEELATGVTSPLTFDALSQQGTTALAGLRVSGNLAPRIRAFGSAGVEHDLQNRGGDYVATGVGGLAAENLSASTRKTRPTASAGLAFDVAKAQQISLNALYRAEAFRSMSSWSAHATYTVGF